MKINNVTRGGQVFAHDVRMLVQVLKTTLAISGTLSLALGYFFLGTEVEKSKLYLWCLYLWAQIKLEIGSLFYKDASVIGVSFFNFISQKWESWQAIQFIRHPFMVKLHHQVIDALTSPTLYLKFATLPALSALGVLLFFYYKGYTVRQNTHRKGIRLATAQELKRELRARGLEGHFHLDGVPLAKDRETTHMLIAGTTGAGKSNCFNHLLPQIRKNNQKAIILDLTGDFVNRYFDPAKDTLLNPTHPDGQGWNLWADATNTFDYKAMSESFIGTPSQSQDSFWSESAKACFAAALEKLSKDPNLETLLYHLTRSSLPEFAEFFAGTSAAAYADPKGERTTVSTRAVLASKIQSLEAVKEIPATFSIKHWVQDESQTGWLFLYAPPSQREVMCPMISAQISTAIKSLMDMPPDSARRCWFILDELPALNKLSSLSMLLAEGRKYGACAVAGIQDFSQLDLRYGVKGAQTILNQMNTKVVFRFTDPTGCHTAAKILGEKEETEKKENISYGANTMRDGISMVDSTNKGFVVTPTEVATLENLECYIRLPESLPITKHKMSWKKH